MASFTLLIVKSLLGASNTIFFAPSAIYLFISLTTISSFSVPADALPWAPDGFNKKVAPLYFNPPIEEPDKLAS